MAEEDKNKTIDEQDQMLAYLQMIQGVINRMSSSALTCKGFAVTLSAGLLAIVIAVDAGNRLAIMAVAFLVIGVFMGFDTYYLYQEKQYRELYSRVVSGSHAPDLDMRPPSFEEIGISAALKSFSVWLFYSMLLLCIIAGMILIALNVI